MGILGIENRTENWKTVEHFYGISDDEKKRLVKALLGSEAGESEDIQIELFWHGFRDFIDKYPEEKPSEEKVAEVYNEHFSGLKTKIEEFRAPQFPYKFNDTCERNYNPSSEYREMLFKNLTGTEVDIVIQCGDYLIVGEAKSKSDLEATAKYVLVHQLIRQHVMATILADICNVRKEIVHFVVGDEKKLNSLKNKIQVKFMIGQGWLKKENVLSWEDIESLKRAK